MAVDTPPTSVASPAPKAPCALPTETGVRERRPSRRAQESKASTSRAKAAVRVKAPAKPKPEPEEEEEEPAPAEPTVGKNGKAKSETYKQAWSVSEQHVLERLLEEIPEGEKNRYVEALVFDCIRVGGVADAGQCTT